MNRRTAKKIITVSTIRYFEESARYQTAVKRISRIVKGRLWITDGCGRFGRRDRNGLCRGRIQVYSADNTRMAPLRRRLP